VVKESIHTETQPNARVIGLPWSLLFIPFLFVLAAAWLAYNFVPNLSCEGESTRFANG
jgi:hypothetical protein